ncbi:MAG: hypothetical protein D6677_07120 [Calditrichaeota bacterium]|nr:MAG: hypothetical protein D6677_07120 [Calditrichota bacterium]
MTGSFTVKAVKKTDSSVSGAGGLVTVTANALSYVLVRTAANNGGVEFADSVFTTDNTVGFYAAGYDQYGNYIQDESVTWSSSGTLDNVSSTGSSYQFAPGTSGSGRIKATPSGVVSSDSTGILTVNKGALATIRIQKTPTDGGAEMNDTTLTADDVLVMYSVGYDADGNFLGRVNANWSGSSIINGHLTPANPTDSVTFTAVGVGAGSVRAESAANTAIYDNTGNITVSAGAVTTVIIRDGPNNAGSEVGAVSMNVGESYTFYANGYDSDGNFSANVAVNWSTTGTLSGLSPTTASTSTTLSPVTPGSGTVVTSNSSGWTDDATGTITVSSGSLSRLEIRTAANNGGVALNDSVVQAGDALTLYAAGYDLYDNYIGDQSVAWSVEKVAGDSIGFFTTTTNSTSNVFNARVVNSGRLKITSGSVNDYSGVIKVTPGAASSVAAITATSVSGVANDFISDSLGVQVKDAYGNVVPGVNVAWTTPSDGQLTPGNSPPDVTDNQGISRSKWRLRTTSSANDTAYATPTGLTAVQFIASVLSSSADSLNYVSGSGQTDSIGATLAQPFVVQVVDSLGNPVSNVNITFSIASTPSRATGQALSTVATTTDASGRAQTIFTLGDKVGTYTVSAYNKSLLNSPQSFTATATAGSAKSLQIVSGNGQTDTVATIPAFPLKIKVLDSGSNPVSGVTLTWSATSDGLVNGAASATGTSDASGVDSVSWTLRTMAGYDTVTVSATGVTNATFTATALAGAAQTLTVVSGDNRTTVAGGNQKIEARVTDVYGNNVAGETIQFIPADRMSALNTTSDDNGLVSAVYTTPSDTSLSQARALLASPPDTAVFNVYGIQYVSNSLSPKSVSTGEQVVFYLRANNPGVDAVPLDTSQSTLTITYNNVVTTTKLDSPLTLTAGGNNTLKFKTVTIGGGFPSGMYTPEIKLVGSGSYSNMNGTFTTDPGELAISPLDISFVNIPNAQDTIVTRGGLISEIHMQVSNNSNQLIKGLTADLTFSPDYGFVETLISGPDTLLSGQTGIYRFSLNIPASSNTGLITVDGTISGTFTSGEQVNDLAADVTDVFRVVPSASLTWDAYAPQAVSENQTVTFTADVTNTGIYDILLDETNTYLQFGGQTFLLNGTQALQGSGNVTTLTFTSAPVNLTAGTYSGTLVIRGTEVGNDYRDTLYTATSGLSPLTVQTIAQANIQTLTLSDTQVSQGETTQILTLQLQNTGGATALIQSADSITFNYSSAYTLTLSSGQTFPLAMPSGISQTFTYNVAVDAAAPTGNDTFSARVAYSDSNSTLSYVETDPAVIDSWNVLSKASLYVSDVNATATKVSQGQSGLTVDIKVKNLGQTSARVDTLYPDFKRNINSYTTATAFPFTLAGGDSQTVTYNVTIDNNAATGTDSLRGITAGVNIRTSEALSHTGAYLDAWQVFKQAQIVINSVTSSSSRVNHGQKNVPVDVVVSNQGDATVLIDSLKLANTPSGSTTDTRLTAIDSLVAGQSKTYHFTSDIANTAPASIVLGAEFYGRDAISNATVFNNSPVVRDTLTVGDAAVLVVDSVYTDVVNFTQGQSNVRVSSAIRNSGTTRIQLDSVGLTFRRLMPGAGATLSAKRLSPATLPSISPGEMTIITFDVQSSVTPRDSGSIEINGHAFGTDVISDHPDSAFAAVQTDTFYMDTPAQPVVIAIGNQASVTEGESNIPVTMTLRNRGSARVRVENVDLNFYNSGGQNANTDYTRQYNTPPLPFLLDGWRDTTVTYTVGVVDSAQNLGTVTHRGVVRGTEINRSVSVKDSSADLSSWTVFGTGALEVVSVTASRDSVSSGDQNIPVQVNIRNGGANPVQVDTVRLSINGGSYADSSLVIYPNEILQASTSKVYTLYVDVLATSSSGVATLNARVEGVDQNTAQQISDASAATTDSWLVQQAFNATLTDNTPTQVSTGQTIASVVTVVNSGEARLVIDSSQTTLYPKNSPTNFVKLAANSPLVIEGKQTVDLIFRPTVSTVAFTDSLILYMQGTENNDGYSRQLTAPNLLTVQDKAVMVIDSTVAARDSVSNDQQENVTIYLRNTGQADLVVDSLIFAQYGVPVSLSPALPYTVSGGSGTNFDAVLDVGRAGTGTISLDARGVGHDGNSNAVADTASTVSPGSWFVASAANVFVSSVISADTLVSQGQTGVSVDVKIKNTGGTPVTIRDVVLEPTTGLYVQHWPAFNTRLNGQDSLVFTATLDVKDNSATGADSLYARADYRNIYTGQTADTLSTVYHQWRIQGTPRVTIVSVTTDPNAVSQGQKDIPVQVRVSNSGTSDARINTLALDYRHGTSNYTSGTLSPGLPLTLQSGQEQIFTIPVSVNNTAQTGLDSIFARLNVTEVISGDTFDVVDSTIVDTWRVESRAVVAIDSVRINPDVASAGQNGLIASAFISSAVNTAAADVLLDSVAINLSLNGSNGNASFTISRQDVPALPLRLAQGKNVRIDFDVNVKNAPASGLYVVDATARYSDANDDSTVVLANALQADTLQVQQAAALTVEALRVVPDTVSQNQTHGRIYIDILNNGEATTEVRGSALTFTPSIDFQELYMQPATPFNLAGGSRDTMVYSFVAPSGFTGTASVSASVNGIDVNTQDVLNAGSAASVNFEVQTPVEPSITQTTPNSTPGEQNEQFHSRIFNAGQATIILNPAQTTLNIVGTAYHIPLDVTSPRIIRATPDTTELIFRDTLLTGLASGEYTLTVTLSGTTNGAAYQNELDAGSLAYGSGLVVINTVGIVGNDHVLQGTAGMEVNMVVSNTSIPLTIDSSATRLIFRDAVTSNENFMENLHRLDTLTILPVGTSTLRFGFDVPVSYPVGETDIYGYLSLDNGSVTTESSVNDQLFVQSGSNAHYSAQSLAPDTVIAREKVALALDFYNTGSSDLALVPDSTYLDFPGTTIPRTYLSARFSLAGGDTTRLVFNEVTIPASESTGLKDVSWRVYGTLINGDVYSNDSTLTGALHVVPGAQLLFASVVIDSARVPRGERNVAMHYTVSNNGLSDAVINNITFNFNMDGVSVSDDWLPVDTGLFPDTVVAGGLQTYDVRFNVADDARLGDVVPAPVVLYRDIRLSALNATSGTITQNDTVTVVAPGLIRLDSLNFPSNVSTPNAPHVNIDQPFRLALKVSNNGGLNVDSVWISFRRDNIRYGAVTLADISAGQIRTYTLPADSLGLTGAFNYSAVIDSARDSNGRRVSIAQPLDNNEVVQVEQRAELQLRYALSDVLKDSLIRAVNQDFDVLALVTQSGDVAVDTSNGLHKVLLDTTGTGLQLIDGLGSERFFAVGDTVRWRVHSGATEINAPIAVRVSAAPVDVNDGRNAFRDVSARGDTLILSTRFINDIDISATFVDAGTLDGDTLVAATDQDSILVSADVIFDPQLDSDKQVRLQLPAGYSSLDGNVMRNIPDDSSRARVTWYIKAKSQASADPDTLGIIASGISRQNNNIRLETASEKYIRTVPKATLSLTIRVDAPSGALDSTVSRGQSFRLRAEVSNIEGAATVNGNGRARIQIDTNFFSLIDSSEIGIDANPERIFTVGIPFYWWVRAEAVTPEGTNGITLQKMLLKALKSAKARRILDGEAPAARKPVAVFKPKGMRQQPRLETEQVANESQNAAAKGSAIIVEVTEVPTDVLSGKPAALSNGKDQQEMRVESPANIAVGDVSAPDTVTTGQTMTVTVTAGAMSDNLENPQAMLTLPDAFDPAVFILPIDAQTGQAVFPVTIPENWNGTEIDTIKVVMFGVDNNTNTVSAMSAEVKKPLVFRKRPELVLKSRIVQPQSANQGILSFGQQVEVEVWVENAAQTGGLPYAGIRGSGTVQVDTSLIAPGAFEPAEGIAVTQSFTALGSAHPMRWILRAPQKQKTYNLLFTIKEKPDDAHGHTPVNVAVSQTAHPVRVKQKEITITMVDSLLQSGGLIRGQQNLPLLAFNISNEGYGDSLFADGLQMALYQSNGDLNDENLLSNESLINLFKTLRVINYARFRQLEKGADDPQDLAEITVDASVENPLNLLFNKVSKLSIRPDTSETLIVLADLQPDAANISFRAVLNSVNVYDVADTIQLALLGPDGNDYTPDTQSDTPVLTVTPDNPAEAFSTYPNPFGRTQDYARINFYLTETADVDIRVFTLLGELVWHRQESALPGPRNYNHIIWDGKNDKGQRVLNGVYICTIQIKPLGGGAAKRYTTKVAYIK